MKGKIFKVKKKNLLEQYLKKTANKNQFNFNIEEQGLIFENPLQLSPYLPRSRPLLSLLLATGEREKTWFAEKCLMYTFQQHFDYMQNEKNKKKSLFLVLPKQSAYGHQLMGIFFQRVEFAKEWNHIYS